METTTASSRMPALIKLFDMDTDFFRKALKGISDEDAHKRLDTKANHIAWLAGSMVNERFEMAALLGVKKEAQTGELFRNHQGIKDEARYPALADYFRDLEAISPELKNALAQLSDEQLDGPFEMPGMKITLFDMLAFTAYRESNIIGQIVLWRRLLGYEAMKYD